MKNDQNVPVLQNFYLVECISTVEFLYSGVGVALLTVKPNLGIQQIIY